MHKVCVKFFGLTFFCTAIFMIFVTGACAALIPCGDGMYNPATQTCCQGKIIDDKTKIVPCG
ncbi:MAG TPA: hypothetical protein PKX11_05710, partial [Methanospirillum sp.]|nr:hypothetical protein [Methanospirillum sp.]